MPNRVETSNPDGVDFTRVMQTTFVLTILFGAPIVALASIPVTLSTWGARASFAIRVGAVIWIVVACGAFLYERQKAARHDATRRETGAGAGAADPAVDEEGGSESPNRGDGMAPERERGGHQSAHENSTDRENPDRGNELASSPSQSSSERTSET